MSSVLRRSALVALMGMGLSGTVAAGGAVQLLDDREAPRIRTSSGSSRKGDGKSPRHSSARFVATDKRDARKARNRARARR